MLRGLARFLAPYVIGILLRGLGADTIETRDAVSVRLAALREDALPALAAARATSGDTEVRARLDEAMAAITLEAKRTRGGKAVEDWQAILMGPATALEGKSVVMTLEVVNWSRAPRCFVALDDVCYVLPQRECACLEATDVEVSVDRVSDFHTPRDLVPQETILRVPRVVEVAGRGTLRVQLRFTGSTELGPGTYDIRAQVRTRAVFAPSVPRELRFKVPELESNAVRLEIAVQR
jgi:hypothetical protein